MVNSDGYLYLKDKYELSIKSVVWVFDYLADNFVISTSVCNNFEQPLNALCVLSIIVISSVISVLDLSKKACLYFSVFLPLELQMLVYHFLLFLEIVSSNILKVQTHLQNR